MAGEEGKSKSTTRSIAHTSGAAVKSVGKPAPVRAPRPRAQVTAQSVAGSAASPETSTAIETAIETAIDKALQAGSLKPAAIIPKKVKAAIRTAPVAGKATPPLTAPAIAAGVVKKDKTMDMNTGYSNGFQNVIADAQDKAKAAFEKGSTMFSDAGEFARGNVEAVVESGKVLASGLQDMGSSLAADGRSAFETMTADLKELAAAKTPADFFKIQSELIRKSFDGAVAYGSKNSEAVLKLATDAFAPISGRVSLAVEKARTTTSL